MCQKVQAWIIFFLWIVGKNLEIINSNGTEPLEILRIRVYLEQKGGLGNHCIQPHILSWRKESAWVEPRGRSWANRRDAHQSVPCSVTEWLLTPLICAYTLTYSVKNSVSLPSAYITISFCLLAFVPLKHISHFIHENSV